MPYLDSRRTATTARERCACLRAPRAACAYSAAAMDVPDPLHTIARPRHRAPRKPVCLEQGNGFASFKM